MAATFVPLQLNRAQRSQLFAHLLVYLFNLTLNPLAPRNQGNIEILQEVGYRLFQFCGEESYVILFPLSLQEAEVVSDILVLLKPIYEQWPSAPTTAMALEHLASCRLLLQHAEQQVIREIEER